MNADGGDTNLWLNRSGFTVSIPLSFPIHHPPDDLKAQLVLCRG